MRAALSTALAAALLACSAKEPADLIIVNAAIYTLDDSQPRADAMAVRDGIMDS